MGKLFCSKDTASGPWMDVASMSFKPARGWQMYSGVDAGISEEKAQELSDMANHPQVRGVNSMEEWCADEASDVFGFHNAVSFYFVDWALPAPALFYKLEVYNNHNSYTALAEINFLALSSFRMVTCCPSLQEDGSLLVSCTGLSGDLLGTFQAEPQTNVRWLRTLLSETLGTPECELRLLSGKAEVLDNEMHLGDLCAR